MQPTLLLQQVILISSIASPVTCFTSYEMGCKPPDEVYNFVKSPTVRGTLQIIWSCVATLFASTYTVLHLNIPEQADGRDVGVKGTLKW